MSQGSNLFLTGVVLVSSVIALIIIGVVICCYKRYQTQLESRRPTQLSSVRTSKQNSLSSKAKKKLEHFQNRKNKKILESEKTDKENCKQPFNLSNDQDDSDVITSTNHQHGKNSGCETNSMDSTKIDNCNHKNETCCTSKNKPNPNFKIKHVLMEEPSGISINSQDPDSSQDTTLSNSPADFGQPLPHVQKKQNSFGFKIRRALINAFRALPANSYFYDTSINRTVIGIDLNDDYHDTNGKNQTNYKSQIKENDRCVSLQVESPRGQESPQLGVLTQRNTSHMNHVHLHANKHCIHGNDHSFRSMDDSMIGTNINLNRRHRNHRTISTALSRKRSRNGASMSLKSSLNSDTTTGFGMINDMNTNDKKSILFEDRESNIILPKNGSHLAMSGVHGVNTALLGTEMEVEIDSNMRHVLTMQQNHSGDEFSTTNTLGVTDDDEDDDDDDTSCTTSEENVALGIKLIIQSPLASGKQQHESGSNVLNKNNDKGTNNNNFDNHDHCQDDTCDINSMQTVATNVASAVVSEHEDRDQTGGGNIDTVAGNNDNDNINDNDNDSDCMSKEKVVQANGEEQEQEKEKQTSEPNQVVAMKENSEPTEQKDLEISGNDREQQSLP